MIYKILIDLETRKVTAVLATIVDWKDAFPHQCPALGIKAFIDCCVSFSLIPILINYFQNIKLVVKWHGRRSQPEEVPRGGPQGT